MYLSIPDLPLRIFFLKTAQHKDFTNFQVFLRRYLDRVFSLAKNGSRFGLKLVVLTYVTLEELN